MKGSNMSVKSNVQDFKRGLQIIFGKPKPSEGDRKLAKMSQIVAGQIDVYGKDTVRRQVLLSIEKDLSKAAKKGGEQAVNKMLENGLSTPEYMKLLHRLGLEEPHLRVMAMQATKDTR